jgi:hypothetical protein
MTEPTIYTPADEYAMRSRWTRRRTPGWSARCRWARSSCAPARSSPPATTAPSPTHDPTAHAEIVALAPRRHAAGELPAARVRAVRDAGALRDVRDGADACPLQARRVRRATPRPVWPARCIDLFAEAQLNHHTQRRGRRAGRGLRRSVLRDFFAERRERRSAARRARRAESPEPWPAIPTGDATPPEPDGPNPSHPMMTSLTLFTPAGVLAKAAAAEARGQAADQLGFEVRSTNRRWPSTSASAATTRRASPRCTALPARRRRSRWPRAAATA